MAIDFLQFLCQFILAGFVVRFAQIKLAGTPFGNALSFIH